MTHSESSFELPSDPKRISALYQYHNAPEVAPAHGIEYDDSTYTHSDKYPVIHSVPVYDRKWNGKRYSDYARPPRIIFGMKLPTFLVVAAIMTLVIVGAAVGGAVGGTTIKNANAGYVPTTTNDTTPTPSSGMSTATASPYAAPTPTFAALSDCPAANNTLYTSTLSSSGAVSIGSNLNYTRYCNVTSPLIWNSTLLSLYTYTFEDCIEACASMKIYNSNSCELAAYKADAARPLNCWLSTYNSTYSGLQVSNDTAVALMQS